jgi:D-alanyl-D-alanine carboxypeptidase
MRDGRRLIAVTINAPSDWSDHKLLLEKGFSDYSVRQIVTEGQCIGTVEVEGGMDDSVQLIAAEDFSYALSQTEQPNIVLPGPGFAFAPVVQGADAGYAYVCIGSKAIGKIRIVYGETVEQIQDERKPTLWERLFGGGSK